MARPRYSAAKRAREIRKQEERARKLARKHNRAATRSTDSAPEVVSGDAVPAMPPEAGSSEPSPEPPTQN
jgi:hypothetical protein